jgi:transposase
MPRVRVAWVLPSRLLERQTIRLSSPRPCLGDPLESRSHEMAHSEAKLALVYELHDTHRHARKDHSMTRRFFGFDVHQEFIVAVAVDAQQNVVYRSRKVASDEFEKWAAKTLTKDDEAVIEAMTGSWITYDLLIQHAGRVLVVHPYHVKLIGSSFIKTDKRDALTLAKLLAANILPEVWVPPMHVRELRSLIYHRHKLAQRRATAKNRVRGILALHRVIGPRGLSAFSREYWESLHLPSPDKLRALHAIADIEMLTGQIKCVEAELSHISTQKEWVDDVACLLQMPGIAMLTAMTVLSAIGDIARFPTPKQLVGYAGLGARVHSSGKSHSTGGITKQGRRELRYAMTEAAWNAIKYSPIWKERFERLAVRIGRRKAAIAIARKMLVLVWKVLTERIADHNVDDNTVAKCLYWWGQRYSLAQSLGIKPALFTRQRLDVLGRGSELSQVVFLSRVWALPPPGA